MAPAPPQLRSSIIFRYSWLLTPPQEHTWINTSVPTVLLVLEISQFMSARWRRPLGHLFSWDLCLLFPSRLWGLPCFKLDSPECSKEQPPNRGFKLILHLFAAPWDCSRLFPLTFLSMSEQSSWQHTDWDNILPQSSQLLSYGFPSTSAQCPSAPGGEGKHPCPAEPGGLCCVLQLPGSLSTKSQCCTYWGTV